MSDAKRFRRDDIDRLAPAAPSCFDSRLQWIEYLYSAAEGQNRDKGGPLVFKAGEPVRLNPRFRQHCKDCSPLYALEKQKQGRCDPKRMAQLMEASEAASIDIVSLATRKTLA